MAGFDYLVIESTGISEPLPVAETFTFENEEGESLSDFAKLDTMVTVVDSVHFFDNLDSLESLKDRGESLGEEDERCGTRPDCSASDDDDAFRVADCLILACLPSRMKSAEVRAADLYMMKIV